ncbi:MAG TPA: discoidin domain-containing protein [Candidatus Methylomirabilis sp.]|nr:discoidin domain-containing protein [Candidatus Methylomirabilis sp.]
MSDAVRARRWRRGARPALVTLALVLTAGSASLLAQSGSSPSPRVEPGGGPVAQVLDDFGDLAPWTAIASDGAQASIHPANGLAGQALRLDFDLAGTAGFALARRSLPLDLPSRYEVSFYVRADEETVNGFQLKLTDSSGENVWWFNRPHFRFGRQWELVRVKSRQIEFAWGPIKDRTLRHAATVELVVVAGDGPSRGSVYLSQLRLVALPEEPTPSPLILASSSLPGAEARFILDGTRATAWKSDPSAGRAQNLTIDFRRPRELGGLVVHWLDRAYASRYDVLFSDDGVRWRTVAQVTRGTGGPDAFLLPDAEMRFLRLALHDGPAGAYGLTELEIRDLASGGSPNAFFQSLARETPRGVYPRGFSGEQVYWTVVGIDGGSQSGLLSEDGALEVATGGFSIEPFVVAGSRTVSWADVETRHVLVDGELPMPGVIWRRPEWELRVSAFASGIRERSHLVARYEVRNLVGRTQALELVLAARPFQVNPPAQSLNTPGGVSPIRDLDWDGEAFSINGERKIFPLGAPDRVGAFPLEAGPVSALIEAKDWGGPTRVHDDMGYASGALGYRIVLAPYAAATVGLVVPLSGPARRPDLHGQAGAAWMDREQAATAASWRERLNRVVIRVPPAAEPLIATLHTALAHILISRDGVALRPGTRSYARSWIRDGAMMAESLLRLGHGDAAAEYLRWYAPYQFASGKVPCCVDRRGADPVAENDSAGELIFLAAEVYRYTGDRALLRSVWPRIEAAARYLDALRRSERAGANREPATRAFYGLLPASISHEGYSEKPMHSYWDDFWALKGYALAAAMANELGEKDTADRLEASREEFRHDLAASLRQAIATHGISYLPGCAELGDFDPTSSTIALAPAGDMGILPAELIRPTYERYWQEFIDRRDGSTTWEAYTPYEIRTVGTFVRLGWRERAQELLAFFLAGRRPAPWNQWAEVVGRDPRSTRFVGDMPHGWVASDFIRSVLDLLAYERDADRALVLAAGIPSDWLDAPGVVISNLRTPYGPLSYTVKREGARVVLQVAAGLRPPPGGIAFVWPGKSEPPRDTRVNGNPATWQGGELHLGELPATVVAREER